MSNVDIIKNFYSSDNFRNLELVDKLVDDNIELDWYSSIGHFKYAKEDILKLTREMFDNYATTNIVIETIFGEGNQVAIKYQFFAATIENPNELMLIANIMTLWEFKNGKLIKGFQTSFV